MSMWVTADICYCPHGRYVTLRFHSAGTFLVFPPNQSINFIELKSLLGFAFIHFFTFIFIHLLPYYVNVSVFCPLVNIGFKNAISKMFYLPLCTLSNNMKLLNLWHNNCKIMRKLLKVVLDLKFITSHRRSWQLPKSISYHLPINSSRYNVMYSA